MKLYRTVLGLLLLSALVILAACGAPADGGMAGEAPRPRKKLRARR